MKKKIIFIVLVLVLIGSVSLFAQERGYIKPTLGITLDTDNGNIFSGFHIDFVSAGGLTLGIQWGHLMQFGIGYTIAFNNLSFGLKLMVRNITFVRDYYYSYEIHFGINANGTWWVNDLFGVTGIANFDTFQGNFSIGAGLSTRF